MPFAQNRLLAASVLIRRCAPQDDGAGYD